MVQVLIDKRDRHFRVSAAYGKKFSSTNAVIAFCKEPEPAVFLRNQLFRYRTMQMTKLTTRHNEQRFIHISCQGWYLRTREGLKGPFENRGNAQIYLDSIIDKNATRSYN